MTNVVWGNFLISDLFEVSTGSLIPASALLPGSVPRVSAKSENNGILGYFDSDAYTKTRHVQNCITVNFFGADGGIFYHEERVSLEMKVHALTLKDRPLDKDLGLFFAACLKKALAGFGYGNQLSSSKLAHGEFPVSLPVKEDKSIDYEYMIELIQAIKTQHISKIQTYLKVSA